VLVTLVVTLVVLVVASTAYRRFQAAYLGHLDRMLEIMAKGVATALDAQREDPTLLGDVRSITQSPWRGPQTHFRLWIDGVAGDLAASAERGDDKTRFLWDLEGAAPPPVGGFGFHDVADKKKRQRAIWLRRATAAGVGNVLIVHPSGFEHRRLRELLLALVATGALTVLLGATLGARLVLTGLRPLARTSERIARIGETGSIEDLTAPEVPTELRPIVDEVAELVVRLRAALEQQRRFVADASHQLRTPISLARSTLEVARSGEHDAGACRRAMAEVLDDLARMQWMVDELLTLAGLGPARAMREPVDLRLDTLLEELTLLYERRASERGVRIVREGLAACVVRGDEVLLRQIFTVLLDNALHYGPAGGTIRVALAHGPDAQCTAEVEDKGGALRPEELERLFDRFYRGEAARDRNPAGAGLGLCIAREAARRHGGDVWASSIPGSRTTFHVRLAAAGT
jgi:signal transduction histidine kinase